jgi:acyl carrier protein
MSEFSFMSSQHNVSDIATDLAEALVSVLQLDVKPADIDPEAPLFGEGLGLDSIDALEIAVCVSERYGIQLRSDDPDNKRIFASLHNLAAHIAAHMPRRAEGAAAASI